MTTTAPRFAARLAQVAGAQNDGATPASTPTSPMIPSRTPRRHRTVRRIALAVVWLTMALSAVVFSEPAPVDALLLGLVIFLPIVGLMRFPVQLSIPLCGWLLVAAFGFLSALHATDAALAARHTAITLYLSLAAIAISGFVLVDPSRHGRLVASGLVASAALSATAGIIGVLDLVPGSNELFTLYGRARGAFKDPNVLGAFLSATVVMAAHLCFISRGLVRACYALAVALILIGLLLSFSRSAWLTAFAAAALYAYLVVLVEPTNRRRLWFLSLIVMGALTAIVLLVGALQISGVGSLLSERATFSQSHDAGPEGRFGGQLKALQLIFEYPLGIGALEFRPRYHHEEPHNVFLSMFLNAGWPGGLIFTALLLGTAVYAFRSVTRPSPWQDLFIVFYAGYIATLIGGLVVDSDHWRHLFIFMGLVWGFSLAPRRQALLPAGLPHSVRGPSA